MFGFSLTYKTLLQAYRVDKGEAGTQELFVDSIFCTSKVNPNVRGGFDAFGVGIRPPFGDSCSHFHKVVDVA